MHVYYYFPQIIISFGLVVYVPPEPDTSSDARFFRNQRVSFIPIPGPRYISTPKYAKTKLVPGCKIPIDSGIRRGIPREGDRILYYVNLKILCLQGFSANPDRVGQYKGQVQDTTGILVFTERITLQGM